MRKLKLWIIPAVFFVVCCALNLAGCLTDGSIEKIVKPALMPLLCVTTFTYLLCRGAVPGKQAALLLAGQLFGFAGDTMLIGSGFAFFAGGIGLFLVGHIFYICLFGGISWRGLKPWQWIAGIAGAIAAAAVLALVIGVNGVMLAPMGIYALALMMLLFSGLTGVLRIGGATWWIILCGALLFTFSDSLIAVRNFGTLSPFMSGFGVMSTYLVAQSLLAIGGVRLCVFSAKNV
ncbi:MAG: lysoplasmalogenase [Bacteroidales bacterium]|nr:lysoplasmalogenase [Bacteroidales bacterium]